MKKKYINIFSRSWGLMMSTTATWESVALDSNLEKKSFKQYFQVWLILCAIIEFVFATLYSEDYSLDAGFIYALIVTLSFYGAYYFTRFITLNYFAKNHKEKCSKIDIEKIISHSFAVVFITKIVTAIIPSLFFLQILNIYTVYIVWEGSRIIFDINEDERGKIMLLITLSIIFTPSIIAKILHFMLPAF